MKFILFLISIASISSVSFSQENTEKIFNLSVFKEDASLLLKPVSNLVDQSNQPAVLFQEMAMIDSQDRATDATRLFYILGPIKNHNANDPIFAGAYIELSTGEIKTALLTRDSTSNAVILLGESAMIFLDPKIYDQGGNPKVKEAADEMISILEATNSKYKFVPRYNLGIVSALKKSDSEVYDIFDKLALIKIILELPNLDPNSKTHNFFSPIDMIVSGSIMEADAIDLSLKEDIDLDSLRVLNSKLINKEYIKNGFFSKFDKRYLNPSGCSNLFKGAK
jgi:hypothetical protein